MARIRILRRQIMKSMVAGISLTLMMLGGISGMTEASSVTPSTIGLQTAAPFAVLAGQTVTNTGESTISGNVGVSPGSAVTGFPPGEITNGTQFRADTTAQQAQNDLTTAYLAAAAQTPTQKLTSLGGQTLGPGVYNSSSSMSLTGSVTLNGGNNPNAVFIFQAGSTLITASNSTVILTNGAQACNVFWQVGSSATLGTGATFVGSILALTSITVDSGTSIAGRVLARNGAITLNADTITVPTCTTATPTPTPTPPSIVTTLSTAPSSHAIVLGKSIHDVATVSASTRSGGKPTGTVQFYECGPGSTSCTSASGTPLNPAEPVVNGIATSPLYTPTAVGTYYFAAAYIPTNTTFTASSQTGNAADGERVVVSAQPIHKPPTHTTKPPSTTKPPATTTGKTSTTTATSPAKVPVAPFKRTVTVPTTHTGEPWAGSLYWVLSGLIGVMGLGLISKGIYQRRASGDTPR